MVFVKDWHYVRVKVLYFSSLNPGHGHVLVQWVLKKVYNCWNRQNKGTRVMQYYLTLKMLHIFGAMLFLGNIIVTAFWKVFADYSKDWRVIAFSQRLVTYTDIFFTTIGVIIIASTGMLMAKHYGNYLQIKWIAWGLSLFIASGIIWVFLLIPLQIKLHRISK